MTFSEALDLMAKGKVVARRSWPRFARNEGIFRAQSDAGWPVLREIVGGRHLAWRPINPDIFANDWEVVDRHPPQTSFS